MNQKFGLSPLTIQFVPPLLFILKKRPKCPPSRLHAGKYIYTYIYIYYIYVITYILYVYIYIYIIYIYIYIHYIYYKNSAQRTQYLCVTEEELLYDSGEQSFDLS